MKTIILKVIIFHLALQCSIFNCMADDLPGIITRRSAEDSITGKWGFESTSNKGRATKSFVEFLGDGRYIFSDWSGFQIDKYTLNGSRGVVLKDVGEIDNAELAKESMDLNLTSSGKTSKVKAQKVVGLEESERTKILSRSWIMLAEEDGKDSVKNIPKTILTFSKFGTCITEAYQTEKVKPFITVRNWTWHPSEKNTVSFSMDNRSSKEGYNLMIINAIDDKTLKIIEVKNSVKRSFVFRAFDK